MTTFGARMLFSLALAGLVVLSSSQISLAAEPSVVAVLDMGTVERKASAFASARKQAEDFQSNLIKKKGEEEKRLKALGDELNKQKTILDAEAFKKKRADFLKSMQEANGFLQLSQRDVSISYQTAVNEIRKKLVEVTAKIAEQKGVDIVLDKGYFLHNAKIVNLTEEVIAQLNKDMPSVKLTDPNSAAKVGKK